MNRSQRIADQLGMPHGTASNRLRKNILFSLVKELEKDTCYKCGDVILSVEEFSIEHVLPWEGRDPELFWDLNNIAFSHVRCNRPHIHNASRKVGPEGTSWCYRCNEFIPRERFHKNPATWDGLNTFCIEHRKEARKK